MTRQFRIALLFMQRHKVRVIFTIATGIFCMAAIFGAGSALPEISALFESGSLTGGYFRLGGNMVDADRAAWVDLAVLLIQSLFLGLVVACSLMVIISSNFSLLSRKYDILKMQFLGANRQMITGIFLWIGLIEGLIAFFIGMGLGLILGMVILSAVQIHPFSLNRAFSMDAGLSLPAILAGFLVAVVINLFCLINPVLTFPFRSPFKSVTLPDNKAIQTGRKWRIIVGLGSLALALLVFQMKTLIQAFCGSAFLLLGLILISPFLQMILSRLNTIINRKVFKTERVKREARLWLLPMHYSPASAHIFTSMFGLAFVMAAGGLINNLYVGNGKQQPIGYLLDSQSNRYYQAMMSNSPQSSEAQIARKDSCTTDLIVQLGEMEGTGITLLLQPALASASQGEPISVGHKEGDNRLLLTISIILFLLTLIPILVVMILVLLGNVAKQIDLLFENYPLSKDFPRLARMAQVNFILLLATGALMAITSGLLIHLQLIKIINHFLPVSYQFPWIPLLLALCIGICAGLVALSLARKRLQRVREFLINTG